MVGAATWATCSATSREESDGGPLRAADRGREGARALADELLEAVTVPPFARMAIPFIEKQIDGRLMRIDHDPEAARAQLAPHIVRVSAALALQVGEEQEATA